MHATPLSRTRTRLHPQRLQHAVYAIIPRLTIDVSWLGGDFGLMTDNHAVLDATPGNGGLQKKHVRQESPQ